MAHATDTETGSTEEPTATDTEGRLAFVERYPSDARVVRWCFVVAFAALGVGGLFGLIQALHRTSYFRGFVSSADYYTILTGHGVLLALVFTTFFIAGLFTWAATRSFGRSIYRGRLTLLWFGMLLVGTLMAGLAIVGGLFDSIPMSADVLFTFYAPLQAHPAFYVGAALIIVGSWLAGANYFLAYRDWRSDNPDARIPLQSFMVLTTMLMWYIATVGVAIEVVVFLIPWSLGLIAEVDPLLTRTLFWYFGHPVVYFWLLPAYLLWYTVLPKLAGGRLFSDGLARIVFVLFLLLSTPTGFHHQYLDPGIPKGFKFIAMTNTMFLLLPSLLTAFTVVASIEHGARQFGGDGYLGWLKNLPWDDPAFSGMAFAGLMFAAAGFSGMVNAGMNLNYLVHNTLWVPGHFHLTVGTAFALTVMAGSFWLVPQVTGKRLQWRKVATLMPYVWFVGMVLMSNAMHRAGLLGVPRRTAEPQYPNTPGAEFAGGVGGIGEMRAQIAIGGVLLFVALAMFLAVMVRTWLGPKGGTLAVNGEIPEPMTAPEESPRVLDNLRLWTALAVLLVLLAYALPLVGFAADGLFAPGSGPVPAWLFP
ncbi:b(o/a)3-type cytochrome-c oxidase subunit 1 [Halorarius halobius]|uniref:b(o/a)3-type cytochrome-c oxidase subunit 1 n=1 Tax=Halorarius halobius TaxID=2962671 RepID=UPI0020CE11F1|nr:b(o/a)3-type cytochrome-c oxidase subunit 1 [Halorarius halobius]